MKRSRSVSRAVVLTAIIGLLAPAAQAAPIGSIFDPYDYGSLGSLNLTTGSIAFDTDALTVTGFSNGVAALSQGSGVEMAVFTFGSISIGSGVTINVTGNRGLVLASHSDLTFDSTLSLDGAAGSGQLGGAGGPGGEGGVAGVSFSSAPPGSARGDGGDGGKTTAAQAGVGYGAGLPAGTEQSGGGGGAYGGAGGNGAANGSGSATGGAGGVVYGDSVLTELYGGSGGAGGRHVTTAGETRGGGGGGGAMELVAVDTLTLNGTLSARGGNGGNGSTQYNVGGGGGSGGGVILAADLIDFNGTVDVRGGAGGDVNKTDRGGGGGGGRVLFASNALTGSSTLAADTLLAGGVGPDLADDGAPGTVQTAAAPLVSPIVHFQEGVMPSVSYVADSVTIRADQATTNQDNDGDFENLVGRVGSNAMRILFEFDLTEIETRAGGNPVTINSVQLNLVTRARDIGSGQGGSFTADLHTYGFDFIESASTWNDPDGGAAANDPTAGGNTSGTVLASVTLDPGIAGGTTAIFGDSAEFRTAVETALAAGDNTLRLLLKMRAESGAGNNFISFRDEVFATAGDRPELVINTIPEPTTMTLLALGALALAARRRRR